MARILFNLSNFEKISVCPIYKFFNLKRRENKEMLKNVFQWCFKSKELKEMANLAEKKNNINTESFSFKRSYFKEKC